MPGLEPEWYGFLITPWTSLAQRAPDESVHEHQEEHLSPGTPKSLFHSAAGATGWCVARPLPGLDQVAVPLLGSVSYTSAGRGQRTASFVPPHTVLSETDLDKQVL